VNGNVVHANYIIQPGDVVRVLLEDAPRDSVIPEDKPVNIVYEDDDIFIIDKTAPLSCQASSKHPEGTLENRVAWRYRDIPGFVFRPLNRLDKGTSGLMCAAKHAHACQILQKQLHTPDFVREYLAVAEGRIEGAGTLDLPMSKMDDATIRRFVDFENGRRAVTHYTVDENHEGYTLVRLRLETGRTHQIRVHLSHIGHPIAGDFLYGTEDIRLPERFALHSTRIRLVHPITQEVIDITSPLPEDLRNVLEGGKV
jgi:23S rRNA pseudouridine1911/1915/1917 synthase